MGKTNQYTDRQRVDAACENILKIIKPGDVINQTGYHKWWQFWLAIAFAAIRSHQKKLFGKDSNWTDVHTMMYLDENNTFSVELPKATLKPLREYCLSNLSIYRLQLTALSQEYIDVLREAVMRMVGEEYDIGQLLDIAINGMLGYDNQRKLTIFDFGRNQKVCSVGVRVAFEQLYKSRIKKPDSRPGKWLFYQLNPGKWPPKAVEKYSGTDVEATSPAHFANSDFFQHEFEFVARFEGGKQV